MDPRTPLRAAALVAAAATLGCGPEGVPPEPPSTEAGRLVARSIAFHDPDGLWGEAPIRLAWHGTDAEGEERMALDLRFAPGVDSFSLQGSYAGRSLAYRAGAAGWSATVDGRAASELDSTVRGRMGLVRDDGLFWRNYFGFLAGLPMKIRDPGARLDSATAGTRFDGREVRSVRVTYDPEVGGDVWTFYFDPTTAALVGARFDHDEGANDGEYLVFEGLATDSTLRLPRERRWYVDADDRFLGTDVIRSVQVGR